MSNKTDTQCNAIRTTATTQIVRAQVNLRMYRHWFLGQNGGGGGGGGDGGGGTRGAGRTFIKRLTGIRAHDCSTALHSTPDTIYISHCDFTHYHPCLGVRRLKIPAPEGFSKCTLTNCFVIIQGVNKLI